MPSYHDELKALAESIGSDGCSSPALQVCVECCWEHDWSYVTGLTPRGVVTSKAEADRRFRDCLQAHSSFRWLSPFSWWRWLGVRHFGHGVWQRPVMAPRSVRRLSSGVVALREAQSARARIMNQLGVTP